MNSRRYNLALFGAGTRTVVPVDVLRKSDITPFALAVVDPLGEHTSRRRYRSLPEALVPVVAVVGILGRRPQYGRVVHTAFRRGGVSG